MGYDSGSSKNSVSSYTPSFSSKDSVSSYSSKDSVRSSKGNFTCASIMSNTNRNIKKLTAARSIKEVLEMIEQLEKLLEKKATIDAEITVIEERINEAMGEVKGDPIFEKIKEYILKK